MSTNPYQQRMLALVNSFPGTCGRLDIWDADGFHEWACGPEPSLGARHAACFILEVWNPHKKWKCGRFDWRRAIGTWDDQHRAAFIAWLQDPFYP